MKFLLDTDHVSFLERGHGREFTTLIEKLIHLDDDDVGISVVTVHEQFLGCHTLLTRATSPEQLTRGYSLLLRIIDNFRKFPLIPFDISAAITFEELKRQKPRISTMDLRIAAIAKSRKMVLVTRNLSDFERVPGLQFENWIS